MAVSKKTPGLGNNIPQQILKHIGQKWKKFRIANLGVLSPGKLISNTFEKHMFPIFYGIQHSNIFRKTGSQVVPQAKLPS